MATVALLCSMMSSCSVFRRGTGCPAAAIGAEKILSGEVNPKKVAKMKH